MLIADSGSTKTDWRLIGDTKTTRFETIGFNPFFQSTSDISKELLVMLLPGIKNEITSHGKIDKIYFYGAGCSTIGKCKIVNDALESIFPQAEITIEHDLLAAARALCGNNEGIAAILGTGSNSCYYDGNKIISNVPSLGFVLGDEGSGAYIGKHFIQDYLNKDLPSLISERFHETYKLSNEAILNSIYCYPMPGKFLASFSKFIIENKNEQYFSDLIEYNFQQFFDKHICKYANHRDLLISCVGSVAYHYSETLKNVAETRKIKIDKILKSPIDKLVEYHLKNRFSSTL